MKSQINLLNQLQELVLTRDEHHQTGDGSHMEALDAFLAEVEPLGSYELHVVLREAEDLAE